MKYDYNKLNALMAEAMGWKRTNDREGAVWIDSRGMYQHTVAAWRPTAKLEQAWSVMDKISLEREWRFIISSAPHWKQYEVTAKKSYGSSVDTWSQEASAQLAITIAILYALRMYGDFGMECDNGCGNPDDLPLRLDKQGYQMCESCRKEVEPKKWTPNKTDVFASKGVFPAMYYECVRYAKELGYDYLEFNTMVFRTGVTSPEFKNAVCMYDELGES